jgi:uncharacterized membrane protein (DUF2068 family)
MKPSETKVLRMIALFKFFKAAVLIVVGLGALRMIHADIATALAHWVKRFGMDPGGRYVDELLQKATTLTPNTIRGIGVGSFIYAGLFLTEGIGLWLLKRWGEWFTIIMTSSLLPIELYEIHRHPTEWKVLLLVFNVAVVAFLFYQLRHESSL